MMKFSKIFSRFNRFLAVCFLFAFSSISLFAQEEPKFKRENQSDEQRELVILVSERSLNLNPHTSSFSVESQIMNANYEGLFTYNPKTLQSENAICEGFKISRDQKTWTFFIRNTAKFSNGDRITANDVKNSWMTLLATENAPFSSLLDVISGAKEYRTGTGPAENVSINAKDENTLVVRLTTPVEYFPNILCHTSFAVVHPNRLVSSGPFKMSEKTKDGIRFTKNEYYWDAENVLLPSIKFLISSNIDENTYQYNNGQIDWAIDGVETSKILSLNDLSLAPQFGTEYMFFRPVHEPWNNAKLRNSLLTAIPWDELQKDSIVKATSLLVPLPGYPDIFGVSEYDFDSAVELFKEAGFGDVLEYAVTEEDWSTELASEQLAKLSESPLALMIAIPATAYSLQIAALLRQSWAKLGVNLYVQQIPSDKYFQSIGSIDADILTYNWIGDFADPMAFLELFRSDSGLNISGWKDEIYDSLLLESSSCKSEDRYEKLSEAEQYLLDQGMVIPISHTISLNILDKNLVKGWYENAMNIHPLKYLYIGEKQKLPNVVLLRYGN